MFNHVLHIAQFRISLYFTCIEII